MIRPRLKCLLLSSACCLASEASAQETVTYSYDALGRLVATSNSGSPNNGLTTSIAYDPAGNRSGYAVTGAGGSPTPTPAPTPTPTGPFLPPTPPTNTSPPPTCPTCEPDPP